MAEAATALTSIIRDRRIQRNARIRAAAALAELGPEQRLAAGRQILDISAEFDVRPHERRNIASHLADVGLHEHAATMLRGILAEVGTSSNTELWAARDLANLGVDYRDEAVREYQRVANDPRSGDYDRAAALAELANSGEPHRTPAIAALRAALVGHNARPSYRCHSAKELIKLGPEYHGEIINRLTQLASSHTDPAIRSTAWETICDLGASAHRRATTELTDLMQPEAAELWDSYGKSWSLSQVSNSDDPNETAAALTALLRDPNRSGETRTDAATALIALGRRFHRAAVDGLVELFRSQDIKNGWLSFVVMRMSGLGVGPRAEFAETLRDITCLPSSEPEVTIAVAEAMTDLNQPADPEIVTALRMIMEDDAAAPDDRTWAAVALARTVPEELSTAAAVVLRNRGRWSRTWDFRLRKLAAWGANVTAGLRPLMSDTDVQQSWRALSAAMVAQLWPERREEAVAELRAQSDDEFLAFASRVDAVSNLVEFDAATRTTAIRYYRSVLDDEHRPVSDRCRAAEQLVELDESTVELVVAAVRRFATSPQFTVEEHWEGVDHLVDLISRDSSETELMCLAISRDPTATASLRTQLRKHMSGRQRLEVERSLLNDRTASPRERVSGVSTWQHGALARQAEMVLRDILTAVDSTPAERVEAAAALGHLAPRHAEEVVRALKELTTEGKTAKDARRKLADLSLTERHRLLSEAECAVGNETGTRRERREAAALICQLNSSPSDRTVEYLRQLARDPRTSDAERVRNRYLLRGVDGLGQLRTIRDDERTPTAIRWTVANQLRDYDRTDRTTGARILNDIATDTTCRPALRWRAARDLTDFGDRGRELGEAALQAIISDTALPTLVRVHAAQALGENWLDQRAEMMRILRELRKAGNPKTRIHTLRVIGRFDPTAAALALSEMAADPTLTAATRLHAAAVMVRTRRDYREEAAVTARAIAHDTTVPWHIRTKAARQLARWSEACRSEAQGLLIELEATQSQSHRSSLPRTS